MCKFLILFHTINFSRSSLWHEWYENLAKASKITLVVQINGKIKDKLEADEGASNDELQTLALNSEKSKN